MVPTPTSLCMLHISPTHQSQQVRQSTQQHSAVRPEEPEEKSIFLVEGAGLVLKHLDGIFLQNTLTHFVHRRGNMVEPQFLPADL